MPHLGCRLFSGSLAEVVFGNIFCAQLVLQLTFELLSVQFRLCQITLKDVADRNKISSAFC